MTRRLIALTLGLLVTSLSFGRSFVNLLTTISRDGNESIPAEVYKIFHNSCIDCHFKGGKRMAMAKVNFEEWDNYSPEKKAKKSADIVRMLKKGAMPPKNYRKSHPEKVPTSGQVDIIAKWASSLSVK